MARYWVAIHRPGRTGCVFDTKTRKEAAEVATRHLAHEYVDFVEINDEKKGTTDRFKKGEEPR